MTRAETAGRAASESARTRAAKHWMKQHCATLLGAAAALRSSGVAALCYHSVGADSRCTTESFRRHLEWLHGHCIVVPFGDLPSVALHRSDPRPVVAITFDDGYRDNYEQAFPLLEQYGFPATFFLTAGLIEGDAAVVDRFRRLRGHDGVRSLEWPQICEMRDAGAVFGAHTYSHPNLIRLSVSEVAVELRRSKQAIEEHLGEPVTMLAYPFGKPGRHYTTHTVAAARAEGFELGATTVLRDLRSSDDPLTLPRLLVGGDDVTTLREKLAGSWNFLGQWHEHAPVWAARLFSPDDFKV